MIRKLFLKIKTALALKSNDAIRVSEAYANAKAIGLLYSYNESVSQSKIDELIEKLEADGKSVHTVTFVPVKTGETPEYAYFNENDLAANGNWKNEGVESFRDNPFDFLISLDWNINKYTQNILAASRAKCRVGRFEEEKSQYFELMINPKDEKYESFLKEVYHYVTNVRNG
jgi:hypothetical protein